MTVTYKLVGFDRATEALAVTHDIPRDKVLQVRTIAGIADNPAVIADWPLAIGQARKIADLIGAKLAVESLDWALEPYTPKPE